MGDRPKIGQYRGVKGSNMQMPNHCMFEGIWERPQAHAANNKNFKNLAETVYEGQLVGFMAITRSVRDKRETD